MAFDETLLMSIRVPHIPADSRADRLADSRAGPITVQLTDSRTDQFTDSRIDQPTGWGGCSDPSGAEIQAVVPIRRRLTGTPV